ncbi:MAG: hypothetical protein ACTMHL_13475, partial [Janibacter sp.]
MDAQAHRVRLCRELHFVVDAGYTLSRMETPDSDDTWMDLILVQSHIDSAIGHLTAAGAWIDMYGDVLPSMSPTQA